jgi:hypothetical protein
MDHATINQKVSINGETVAALVSRRMAIGIVQRMEETQTAHRPASAHHTQ